MYCLFKHIFDKVYTKADQLIILGRNMANVLEQKVGKGGGNPKVTIIKIGQISAISNHSHSRKVG